MEEQIVRSYIRYKQAEVAKSENTEVVEPGNVPAYILVGGAAVLMAIVFWQISVPVALVGGAGYGLKTLLAQSKPVAVQSVTEAEEAPQAAKPKRHWQRRLKVYNYQTGKTIRV